MQPMKVKVTALYCVSIRLDNLQSITVQLLLLFHATPSRRFVLRLDKSRLFIDANESSWVSVCLGVNRKCTFAVSASNVMHHRFREMNG